MKLSSDTLAILKNFAAINSNIVIQGGSTLKTMAEAKNVMASADIKEEFAGQFGIYDLSEFLSVYSMFESPDLEFAEDNNSVSIKEGRTSVKYYFSDPSILTSPSKEIKMPNSDLTFTLTQDDLSAIRKASSALGCSELVLTRDGDKVLGTVTNSDNKTSNSYTIEIDIDGQCDLEEFSFVFSIPNFKIMAGDYKVEITTKLISQFSNENGVKYFIALEKSSKV